ncbi:MAG: hypothetical protein IH986_07815 [Planctomycetes bacterium]|nr:hypothetical protein [Planctomycetota bacterium]
MKMTTRGRRRRGCVIGVVAAVASAAPAQTTGPSSSESPYLLPVALGVETVSLLTVGDTPRGSAYRLVGIPDGMGAHDNGNGTFTILLNHELTTSSGVTRAHGGRGAFVSRWIVDASTFELIAGEDLIREVFIWNATTQAYEQSFAERFSRFCSGDLPAESAFYNAATGLGTRALIYTNGEETGSEGRAFAHIAGGPNAGRSFDLPRCGKLSFENAVAAPLAGDVTVVVGLDDVTGGQVYVYVGRKTDTGNEIEKAGLSNGSLFGVAVDGLPAEIPANGLGGPTSLPFQLHKFGDVSAWSGSQLHIESVLNGVTAFLRPEDGHWDPRRAGNFYWCTTGASGGPGRLWRLRFDDILDPAAGGTIEMLLDGTEGVVKPDNLTVTSTGHVLIQEDPSSSTRLARIWLYDIAADSVTTVAEHDFEIFHPNGSRFLTTNEESSGIIDARGILGDGWFLCDVQAHVSAGDPELVERGQLLALFIPQAAYRRGDLNCDGDVNAGDISPFFLALVVPSRYASTFPDCEPSLADLNADGHVDGADIDVFFSCLGGGGCP